MSEGDKLSIVKDYNDGVTVNEIIEKYHIARSTLYKVLHDMAQQARSAAQQRREGVNHEKH
jgi:Mor family transcriptional regulator